MRVIARTSALFVLVSFLACGGPIDEAGIADQLPGDESSESNPMLAIENESPKEDTAYVNPYGKEVEIDLEADVQVTGYGDVRKAPAELAQFALTYFRKKGTIYIEQLAESVSSADRVEWRIGTTWKSAREAAAVSSSQLTHFRIRNVNAVVLDSAASSVALGRVYKARVPRNPYGVYTAAGTACAESGGHIQTNNDVYWYVWEGDRCSKIPTQDMTVTVSKLLPKGFTVYPEYDKLMADRKITAVILFGQIGDGVLTDSDPGVYNLARAATTLLGAGYREIRPAPVGRRFSKTFSGTEMQVDLYSPRDFAGLGDRANFPNLQKAITEHEIVAYDGHSMLGASDFWSRPRYPSSYQIYLYGGCLGYEYYVRPIYEGKGKSWSNLDLMSSVIEVTADANRYALPTIAKITNALTTGYRVSWQSILSTVRSSVGDSTFGVSGVRDNRFCPPNTTCGI
jgi:hypothetical protein